MSTKHFTLVILSFITFWGCIKESVSSQIEIPVNDKATNELIYKVGGLDFIRKDSIIPFEIRNGIDLWNYRYWKLNPSGEFWNIGLKKGTFGYKHLRALIHHSNSSIKILYLSYVFDEFSYQYGNKRTFTGSISILDSDFSLLQKVYYIKGELDKIEKNQTESDISLLALCGNCPLYFNWCFSYPQICPAFGGGSSSGGNNAPGEVQVPPMPEWGGGGWDGLVPNVGDITLEVLGSFRSIYPYISIMEDNLGINNNNRQNYVFLGDMSQTVPTVTGYRIFIRKNLSIQAAKYAYVHELSNAQNIGNIKNAVDYAKSNPKNNITRTNFARALAFEEAKGIIAQTTLAIEAGELLFLAGKLPESIIQGVQMYRNVPPTISLIALIQLISTWIETDYENAVDENGNAIFQGYLNMYDSL